MPTIYHISGWTEVKNADAFTLHPGPQHAEGVGVYFSEGAPRWSAAEGTHKNGVTGVVVIEVDDPRGWWRSKGVKSRRFGKPRTWHTDGKSIECRVIERWATGGVDFLRCHWRFKS